MNLTDAFSHKLSDLKMADSGLENVRKRKVVKGKMTDQVPIIMKLGDSLVPQATSIRLHFP